MRRPRDLEATSQLQLGAKGLLDGAGFELVGRRCIQGVRGQIWNEWTLRFDEARSVDRAPVFLAESWGSFALYREGSVTAERSELHIGMPLPWMVVERGTAVRLAAWGDLGPAADRYEYIELSHRTEGKRASLAENETFLGVSTSPAALGLTLLDAPPMLVAAPNVSAPSGVEMWLDIGDVGAIEGVEYRVLGLAARREVADEAPARWQDYLLYNASVGLRWLSVVDGHWSFATPIDVGPTGYEVARLDETITAVLEWASGELPWSAEIGEAVMMSERGPLVFEQSATDVSAARVHKLRPDDVARGFKKRSLPRPAS